jgi:RND family efflux transporter MFP subunit
MHSKQNDPMELVQGLEPKAVLPHRSPIKFLLAAVVVVVLIIIGVVSGHVPRWRQQTELAAQTLELLAPTVTVVSPKPGQSSSGLPLPAEIKPWVEAPIYARANGYLKRRLVDIGVHVEAGQLLAEIDTPELNQELERARAQLAQAEAALGLSKITAARWAGLLKTASVSEQENAEKQADFKLKTATTESARAEVRRMEKLQSFTRVMAPFAGTITARNIDSGDLIVAAGSKELFHLAQTLKLRVFVQVPQAMARSILSGQTAEMTVPELPGRSFTAKVIRTAGVISADSRTLLVELEVDNPKEEILAGGYAQMRFPNAKMEAALTLPANTVIFRAEGPQVGAVQKDGKVELRTVKLGRDFGQTIEVLAGVSPNDRVIVNPSESLANGATVSISEATKTEKSQ